MDNKTLPSYTRGILIALVLVLVAVQLPALVLAQGGICPDDTQTMITPLGWQPGSMAVCVESNDWQILYDSTFPCGSVLRYFNGYVPNGLAHEPLTLVFPSDMAFPSGYARFGFYVAAVQQLGGNPGLDVNISSYDENNFRVDSITVDTGDYPTIEIGDPGALYSRYAAVRDVIFRAEEGGSIIMRIQAPPLWYLYEYAWAGVVIVDSQQPLPQLCNINGTPIPTPSPTPVTNTPTAQPTPTGTIPNTWTPTYTPTPSTTPQSFPTSPGGTPSPFPTSTPYQINTRRAEATSTPLSISTIPGMVVPTLDFPSAGGFATPGGVSAGLTPNATTIARVTDIAEYADSSYAIATAWVGNIGVGSSYFEITQTVGMSTPIDMADQMVDMVAEPISWALIIQEYAPNLWYSVFWMLVLFSWIIWVTVVKFGFTVVVTVINWIYKLIELIPGF